MTEALHGAHHPGSGDGFVVLADGSRRWGRFGAAGVLVRHVAPNGEAAYFLARRSEHCHLGGTWAVPGGALDAGEAPLAAALREFAEETGIHLGHLDAAVVHEDDHGGWSYWTCVVDVPERFDEVTEVTLNWETSEARWVSASEVAGLELLGAFRATLDRLGLLPPPPSG